MLVNTRKANPKVIKINILWSYIRVPIKQTKLVKHKKAISLIFLQHCVAGGDPSVS